MDLTDLFFCADDPGNDFGLDFMKTLLLYKLIYIITTTPDECNL